MGAPGSQRVSPGRVVLIMVLLLGMWLAFQFRPQKKPALPPVTAVSESRLQAVGLPDNPDWDGLPEFFAIVADRAEWKDGRTRFAYWHPVMKTYSYYFEALRDARGVRFREIAEPRDPDHLWDEPVDGDPIRFYRSGVIVPGALEPVPTPSISNPTPPSIKTGRPDEIKLPPPDLKPPPPDLGQKR